MLQSSSFSFDLLDTQGVSLAKMVIHCLLFCGLVALVAGDSVRVEFKLGKLETQGIQANGKKCDVGSACDPRLVGVVDTEKPLAAWPGPKPITSWQKIFEADDKDTVNVNKIVSKDVCVGSAFNKANLRVDLTDKDVTGSDQMEQFECLSGRDVRLRENVASWSQERPCNAKYNPNKVKLNYSWRAFNIRDADCGKPVTSSGTGSSTSINSKKTG